MSFLRFLVVIFGTLQQLGSIQINVGECPINLYEPCNTGMVNFILMIPETKYTNYLLDPYDVVLPFDFNIFAPFKVVVHGYGGLPLDVVIRNVTSAYQSVGYNVVLVDWTPLAKVPCYATAYLNTRHVGDCLATLSFNLLKYNIVPDLIHVVGFSLGAHVAGFAGFKIQQLTGQKFYRITGLDPALPFFATLNADNKLDSSDASFVDVIHTSAGTFGKIEAIGDVDFYVNGGMIQPQCYKSQNAPLCSHIMAGLYFAESITFNKTFIGIECNNVFHYYIGFCSAGNQAIMGEHTHILTRGIYFVETFENATTL